MLDSIRQEFIDPGRLGALYAVEMDLAGWVRAARAHGKLTMQQLGDELGLTRGAIYHWEHDNNNPSFQQIARIAEITGYPMPLLAGGEPPAVELPSSVNDLSGSEGMLVGLYRILTPEAQAALIHQVRERAASYGPISKDDPITPPRKD